MHEHKQKQNHQNQWLWAIGLWLGGFFSCVLLATIVKMILRLVS